MEYLFIWVVVELAIIFLCWITSLGVGWGIAFSIGFTVILAVVGAALSDGFDHYCKNHYQGDHPYYEWRACRNYHNWAKRHYDPDTFCKMDVASFISFFNTNPERYKLEEGCPIFLSDNKSITIVFKRRELFKYFKFRRNWLQSRQLVKIIEYVQEDIDRMREDAQAYIDKAKAGFKSDFHIEEKGSGT